MHLKETFDSVAAKYDSLRPKYSDEIAEDILSNLPKRPFKALEIGCGTGQATEMFVDHDVDLLCIDIGSNLLMIAQEKYMDRTNVQFFNTSFEDFEVSTGTFDLIFAATSFHWIDLSIRYVKSAQLLRPDGILAVISQKHIYADQGFFKEVQEFYRSFAPGLMTKYLDREERDEDVSPMRLLSTREYPWGERYTADEYINLLGTYSDHINLLERDREKLFKSIHDLITSDYSGMIEKDYQTRLDIYCVS